MTSAVLPRTEMPLPVSLRPKPVRRVTVYDVERSLMSKRLTAILQHPVSETALWLFGGQGLSITLQAAYVLLLARVLGKWEYGLFAGATAIASTATPLSDLGSGMLFMRYVPVERDLARVYWGNCIAITTAMTLALILLSQLLGERLMGRNTGLLLVCAVIATCMCGQITTSAGMVFQTLGKPRNTAALKVVATLFRVTALVIAIRTVGQVTAREWAAGAAAASAGAAALSLAWVWKTVGSPSFDLGLVVNHFYEGIEFAVAGSTQVSYNDLDKSVLAHYGMHAANGIYTLGYRIIDLTTAPIAAIDSATLTAYFARAHEGMPAIMAMARKVGTVLVPLGSAIGLTVLLLSPEVLKWAGPGFSETLSVIRILCWLPVLRSIHQGAGTALTGAGYQRYRTIPQVVVAIANCALVVLLIPRYGWKGAAWSSVASDGLLAVMNLISVVWIVMRSEGERSTPCNVYS